MHKNPYSPHTFSALLSVFLFINLPGFAQDLPSPSPQASVKQTVGITNIEINYSSPGVKGRTIWGDLVPYDQLWRTGANMATQIRFEHRVIIDGNRVPAGTYALFSIPDTGEWTIVLNKHWNQPGTSQYDEEEDLVRLEVKPQSAPFKERLAFYISQVEEDEAEVSLHWEKVMVTFSIDIPTDEIVMEGIKKQVAEAENAWRMYAQSAQFALESSGDEETAFEWIGRSLDLQKNFYNKMIEARMYAFIGDHKTALKSAKESIKLGDASDSDAYRDFWKAQIEANIVTWEKEK